MKLTKLIVLNKFYLKSRYKKLKTNLNNNFKNFKKTLKK